MDTGKPPNSACKLQPSASIPKNKPELPETPFRTVIKIQKKVATVVSALAIAQTCLRYAI